MKQYLEWLEAEIVKANKFGHISTKKNELAAAEKWYCIAAAYEEAVKKLKDFNIG